MCLIIIRYLFYLDSASIHLYVWLSLSYHVVSRKYSFLCIIPSSVGLPLQLFVDDHRFWLLCLIMSHHKSFFLLIVLILSNWFFNLLRSLICWYIVCNNMNYKVMWVFPKRRFDVVLYTFNPQTGKKFYMHLTLF